MWILFVAVFFGWAGYTYFNQSAAITDKGEQLAKKQKTSESVTASLNQLKYEVSDLMMMSILVELARKWYNIYPQGKLLFEQSNQSNNTG